MPHGRSTAYRLEGPVYGGTGMLGQYPAPLNSPERPSEDLVVLYVSGVLLIVTRQVGDPRPSKSLAKVHRAPQVRKELAFRDVLGEKALARPLKNATREDQSEPFEHILESAEVRKARETEFLQ